MSYEITANENKNIQSEDRSFYGRIMLWLAASFISCAGASILIGPMIPASWMIPLYIVSFVAILLTGFVRNIAAVSNIMAIVIPAILGIILYPTLNLLVKEGMGNIITISALGSVVIFGGMAVWGWTSQHSINKWGSKLFFILLGIIAVSFLNIFLFHLPALSMLISVATLIIFSIYSFYDIQRIKNHDENDYPSQYALDVFLDIYNMFVSLLNILSNSSDD